MVLSSIRPNKITFAIWYDATQPSPPKGLRPSRSRDEEAGGHSGRQVVILGAARTPVESQGDGGFEVGAAVSFADEEPSSQGAAGAGGSAGGPSGPGQEEMEEWIESVRTTGSATFQPKTPKVDPFPHDRPGGEQTPLSTAQVLEMAGTSAAAAKSPTDWRNFYNGEIDSDDSSVSSGSLSDMELDEASLEAIRGTLALKAKAEKKQPTKRKNKKKPLKASEKGKAGVPATTTRNFLTAAYLKPRGKVAGVPSKVWLKKLGYTSKKRSLDSSPRRRRRPPTAEKQAMEEAAEGEDQVAEEDGANPGVGGAVASASAHQAHGGSSTVVATMASKSASKSQRSSKTTDSELASAAAAAGVDSGALQQVQTKLKAALYAAGPDILQDFIDSGHTTISGYELTEFLRREVKISSTILSDEEILMVVAALDNTKGLGLVTIENLTALVYMDNPQRKINDDEETLKGLSTNYRRLIPRAPDDSGNEESVLGSTAGDYRQARKRWRALYDKLTNTSDDAPAEAGSMLTRASIEQRLRKDYGLMQEFGEVLGLRNVRLDEDELLMIFDRVLYDMMSQVHTVARGKVVVANGTEVLAESDDFGFDDALQARSELSWKDFSTYLHKLRVRHECRRKEDETVLLPGSSDQIVAHPSALSAASSPTKTPKSPRLMTQSPRHSKLSEEGSIDGEPFLDEDELEFFNLLLRNKANPPKSLSPEPEHLGTPDDAPLRRTISAFDESTKRDESDESLASREDASDDEGGVGLNYETLQEYTEAIVTEVLAQTVKGFCSND